jgi:hypothetical protein
MLTKLIDNRIQKAIVDLGKHLLIELDPEKNYILVVPKRVSVEEIRKTFMDMKLKTNVVVLSANDVKIIELD